MDRYSVDKKAFDGGELFDELWTFTEAVKEICYWIKICTTQIYMFCDFTISKLGAEQYTCTLAKMKISFLIFTVAGFPLLSDISCSFDIPGLKLFV